MSTAGKRSRRADAPLAALRRRAYPDAMTETSSTGDRPAVERIEQAIARIEAAVTARAAGADALARRHAALKARMADAVAALDEVIARTGSR